MTRRSSDRWRRGILACSICLRTQLHGDWLEAEDVIRELRTYEQPNPTRLLPALCGACETSIARRRSQAAALEDIAA